MNEIESNITSPLVVNPRNKIVVNIDYSTPNKELLHLSLDANGIDLYTKKCKRGDTITFNLDELNIQKNIQFKVLVWFTFWIDNDALTNNESTEVSPLNYPATSYKKTEKSNFIIIYTDNSTSQVSFKLTSKFKLIKV